MRLLEGSDVLIVSFNPSKLDAMGLDPAEITSRFPTLVYCVLSGFGLTGPDASLPGYDLIAQARSGLMSVTGPPGGPPQRMSTALTDIMAGTVAAMTITASLVQRLRTGSGQLIDVSLIDAALALMAPRVASYAAGEPEPRPSGATDSVLSIYQAFPTADRPLVVAIGNDGMWRRFCEAIGREDLASDPRLQTNLGRRSRRPQLVATVSDATRQLPSELLIARLRAASIPCAPVQFLSDVLADPHIRARGSIRPLAHPGNDGLLVVDQPWRLGDDPRPADLPPAPAPGEHSIQVMREAGYSASEIDELIGRGALWTNLTPAS
jgi:crotonobetainyl-CoA:carnitine CoA-transferase CaiB-like acyl-CoA transferase